MPKTSSSQKTGRIRRRISGAEAFVKGSTGVHGFFKIKTPSGDMLIEGSLGQIPDHKGEASGLLLLGQDVTENRTAALKAENNQKAMARAQSEVVSSLQASLAQLAKGDLSAKIDEQFSGEYEALRANYNETIEQLRISMAEIIGASETIRGDAGGISAAAEDLSKRTEHQAATLEQTAAAVDQLTSSVKSTADGATEASEVVSSARDHATASGKV